VSSNSITLRAFTPADADELLALHVLSIRTLCSADYEPYIIDAWTNPKRPEHYIRAMENGEHLTVATDTTGRLLGFSAIDKGEVKAVYVHPDHIRRGIGAKLLSAAEDHARADGFSTVHLDSSLTAIPFYVARGYTLVEHSTHRFGKVDMPCARMSKRL
jgi:GNAT superfamily N-acetyltransferase